MYSFATITEDKVIDIQLCDRDTLAHLLNWRADNTPWNANMEFPNIDETIIAADKGATITSQNDDGSFIRVRLATDEDKRLANQQWDDDVAYIKEHGGAALVNALNKQGII